MVNRSYSTVTRMRAEIPTSPRISGILFDFGGTLDGDGLHWLDRFYQLYASSDLPLARSQIRAAFDFAEARALEDPAMQNAPLEEMVRRHVHCQFAHLSIDDRSLEEQIATQFTADVRVVANRNRALLEELAQNDLRLGVISNGCGNTAELCDELGFSPYLAVVLDSKLVGLSKPDPQFFVRAAQELGLTPDRVLMVGDSLVRDIQPAKQIGMQTAWLIADRTATHPAADYRISVLPEMRAVLTPLAPLE